MYEKFTQPLENIKFYSDQYFVSTHHFTALHLTWLHLGSVLLGTQVSHFEADLGFQFTIKLVCLSEYNYFSFFIKWNSLIFSNKILLNIKIIKLQLQQHSGRTLAFTSHGCGFNSSHHCSFQEEEMTYKVFAP